MRNVNEIAFATPRLEALIFGFGDYSASQGIDPIILYGKSEYPGDPWHYGRWQLAIAARSAGIDAIDGRSEEHTSELQSLMRISYAVFCLKKKITQKNHIQYRASK